MLDALRTAVPRHLQHLPEEVVLLLAAFQGLSKQERVAAAKTVRDLHELLAGVQDWATISPQLQRLLGEHGARDAARTAQLMRVVISAAGEASGGELLGILAQMNVQDIFNETELVAVLAAYNIPYEAAPTLYENKPTVPIRAPRRFCGACYTREQSWAA